MRSKRERRDAVPVLTIAYRYQHHSRASGYDRLADFVGSELPLSKMDHYLGESVYRIPALIESKFGGQFEYSRSDYTVETSVIKQLRKRKDTVFHFLYGEKSYRRSARYSGTNGNKLVATLHHPAEHYEFLFKDTNHLRALDYVFTLCDEQADFVRTLVDPKRVGVLPHGIDIDVFKPDPSKRKPKRCLYSGDHGRDLRKLAEIVPRVLDLNEEIEFVMVSKDPRVKAIAERHSRAKQLAELSDRVYLDLIQSGDLMILPLSFSTATNAALEAMACGVPVLATEGGVQDYIVPDGGWVFPRSAVSEVVEMVSNLLSDENKLRMAKKSARRQAERFAWDRVANNAEKTYQQLLSKGW